MTSALAHQEARISAAKAFVKTVVIVDDYFQGRTQDHARSVTPIPSVGRGSTTKGMALGPDVSTASTPDSTAATLSEDGVPPGESESHQLHEQDLIMAFAQRGIVSSAINSSTRVDSDELLGLIVKIGQLSDVLVLDWARGNDGGKFALSVIRGLLESSRRILVVIYTGSGASERGSILKELARAGAVVNEDSFTAKWNKGQLSGVVVQKSHATGNEFYADSKVAEKDLPARVLELFGEINGGLLANAAMHGLAAIREGTHTILDTFDSDLDASYAVHRAETVPRSSAETQLESLVADSLLGVLRGEQLWKHANDSAVRAWLATQPELIQMATEVAGSIEYVVRGVDGASPDLSKNKKKKLPATFYSRFQALAGAETSINRFGDLIYCEPHAEPPQLVTGTIVRREDAFLVCMMPACDCERIPAEGVSFPFVVAKLGNANSKGKRFVKVPDGTLEIDVAASAIRTVHVAGAGDNEPIHATKAGDRWVYATSDQKVMLEFVATLRPMIAHDLQARLSHSLGRVGLMESEFIRRLGS